MSKPTVIIDEIQEIKARIRELQQKQIAELRARRQQILSELGIIEKQIVEITGTPSEQAKSNPIEVAGRRKRARRLPKLDPGSEEYVELGRKVQRILANEPTGLNGKMIAEALGYSQTNERNRIKDLLNDNHLFKRTGQGLSTRFFLR
jgi:hypothetical protein